MPCVNHLPLRNYLWQKQKKYALVEEQYQELLRQSVTGSVPAEKNNEVAEAKRARDAAQSAIEEHVRICEICQSELSA